MGRALPVFLCLGLTLQCGCAGLSPTRQSRCQTRWSRLCAQMRPQRPPPAQQSRPPTALTPNQAEALQAAAGEVMASVVHVQTVVSGPAGDGQPGGPARPVSLRSGGTGVAIASDGLILTSGHVVRNATDIRVVLPDGSHHVAESIVVDERLDLAVLRVNVSGLRSLTPARNSARFGAPVVAIGWNVPHDAARARPGVVTDASTSLQNELDPTQERYYGQLIESTAELEPGFSGGPLLDMNGKLIGLNVAVSGSRAGRRAYAIRFSDPVNEVVARLVAQVMEEDGQSEASP